MSNFSKAFRILLESSFIAKVLRTNLTKKPITGDPKIDHDLFELFDRNAERSAYSFVATLFVIAQGMGFSEWTDFWYDMGSRIYGTGDDNLIDFE